MTQLAAMARPPTATAGSSTLPRLLPGPGDARLAWHLRRHGRVPYRGGPGTLIEELEAAGLTGRGGAAFPAARKMAAVAAGRGRPVVVGNGAEGEPASGKDKKLLRHAPHLVLDGLQLAAEALGTWQVHLYVHRAGQLPGRLRAAIAERQAAGIDRAVVQVVTAPPRFIAGEESALANLVGGGLALPTFTPPRIFERGVRGAPTLVQNVETLAHVALIARHGAAWFREVGTPDEPGSMLTTCHRADGAVTVTEVAIGAPIADLLGLDAQPARAVLTGGYHGTWLPAAVAAGLPLANAALRPFGAAVGAGVLAALPPDRCGLAETARVARYLAAESAGQCGPCLAGLPRIAEALAELARPHPGRQTIRHLARWTGLVTGRGACRHPDGTVRFVRSALEVFADEITAHRAGRCAAGGVVARAPFLPVPAGAPVYRDDWR